MDNFMKKIVVALGGNAILSKDASAESQQEAEELVLMYCDELEMREVKGYENVEVLPRYTIITDEEPYTSEDEEEEDDDQVDEYH